MDCKLCMCIEVYIYIVQVNEKGIVEKAQDSSSVRRIVICITLCACIIDLLHELWMCFGMQRNTHITGNNFIPIPIPINFVDGSYMVSSIQEFS